MNTKLQAAGQILLIPLQYVKENPLRPRIYYNDAHTLALMRSIAQSGIVEPLTVCRGAGGKYVIISGERRFRAAKKLGMQAVPCVLIEADAENALFTGFSNQLNHEALNCFETAMCYEKLRCSFGLTLRETAEKLGVPLAEVLEKVRLLQIPPRLRKILVERSLGEGYARILARHPAQEQAQLLERIVEENLSLRAARSASKALMNKTQAMKGSVRACFKDATVFLNTLDRACAAIRASGVPAEISRAETEGEVEYRISISKQFG